MAEKNRTPESGKKLQEHESDAPHVHQDEFIQTLAPKGHCPSTSSRFGYYSLGAHGPHSNVENQKKYFPAGNLRRNACSGSGTSMVYIRREKLQHESSPDGISVIRKSKADALQCSITIRNENSTSLGKDDLLDVKPGKVLAQPFDRKLHNPTASCNLPPLNPLSKVYDHVGKVPSFDHEKPGQLRWKGTESDTFGLKSQILMDNDRNNVVRTFDRCRGSHTSNEVSRGPRANRQAGSLSSKSTKSSLCFLTWKARYNLQDFQVQYREAKFYMIKSYGEDDIHKSIKYNVWSSTLTGNKKLDGALREIEARSKGDTKCPLFLFFSVNASGQFVGLAEMIGPVDFNKNMDFWQQDKWLGFFPVKWHIVKDIPNFLFRDIILEKNDNRAVTFSCDTQEIGHPQGIRMLEIFKAFQAATSILDDFDFYDERERSLRFHRRGSANRSTDSLKQPEVGRRIEPSRRTDRTPTDRKASLVALTKNLSLSGRR